MTIKDRINNCFSSGSTPHQSYYPLARLRKDLSCYSDDDFIEYCIEKKESLREWMPQYSKLGYFSNSSRYLHNPFQHILTVPTSSARISTVYIPKNGCTMVKKMLLMLAGKNLEGIYPGKYHPMAEQELRSGVSDITDFTLPRFEFILIRDPLKRFWSAFLDKFISKPEKNIIQSFLKQLNLDYDDQNYFEILKNLNFHDLVDLICNSPDNALDKHFCSQSAFFSEQLSNRFQLFTVDNLNSLSKAISNITGKNLDVSNSPHSTAYGQLSSDCNDLFADGSLKNFLEYKEKYKSLPQPSVIPFEIQRKILRRFATDSHYLHLAISSN